MNQYRARLLKSPGLSDRGEGRTAFDSRCEQGPEPFDKSLRAVRYQNEKGARRSRRPSS